MTRRSRQAIVTSQRITPATQIRARVNRFLLSEVGSQFCAGEPQLDTQQERWQVPILFVTPGFVAGQAGEAIVNSQTLEVEQHTDIHLIHKTAEKLRKQHHAAIKTAFLQAAF